MSPVRILNVSRVPLLGHRDPPPPNEMIQLSFFDAFWIGLPPIQRLFLYDNSTLPSFPSLIQSLKSSLSFTLLHYYPLAGKLTYLSNTGDVVVDVSADAIGDGVTFIEAESDEDPSRLARSEVHEMDIFLQLVPQLDVRALPASVLAVQVTRFPKGGLALGFAVHHVVADGRGLWRFLETWASECREGGGEDGARAMPCHDRVVIGHPRLVDIARQTFKHMAPALPSMATPILPIEGRLKMMRRTFMVDASSIKSLKEQAACPSNNGSIVQPSTFVALSAHFWISFVQANGVKDDEAIVLVFLVDCRPHLNPPIQENFTGNCVKPCYVEAKGFELHSENRLAHACRLIKKAIDDCLDDPLKDCEAWVSIHAKYTQSRLVYVSASPRFKVYETDFGWGRPSRVELVSMNYDGEVAFVAGKEEGSIQASVAISPLQEDDFASIFVAHLGG